MKTIFSLSTDSFSSRIHGLTLILALIVSCAAFAAPARANLIVNGAFDTDAGSWTSGGIGAGGYTSFFGNPAGSFLLNNNGSVDSDPFIEQTVSGLSIGASYTIGFETARHVNFAGSSANTNASFGVFVDGAAILLKHELGVSFVSDAIGFTATSASHTIRFAAELSAGTLAGGIPGVVALVGGGISDVSYYLDNVSLTADAVGIPAPTSGLLLLAGLAGLYTLRRR